MIDHDVFRETQQELEYEISDLKGLIFALDICIRDHNSLSNNAAGTTAILCLCNALVDKVRQAEKVHGIAWHAVLGPPHRGCPQN